MDILISIIAYETIENKDQYTTLRYILNKNKVWCFFCVTVASNIDIAAWVLSLANEFEFFEFEAVDLKKTLEDAPLFVEH